MSWKFDFEKLKFFIVHVMKALAIDFVVLERSAELALSDRLEPLADVCDSPGERVACGEE